VGVDEAPPGVSASVDLVVNTYERSYRRVLESGFFKAIEEQCRFPFAGRVALINNVDDENDARRRAETLVATGELTGFELVRERLPWALQRTGLRDADLGTTRHYIDAMIVAVTLPGAPWLVYWDADIRLAEPADWITPSIELMEHDARVLCANPENLHHPVRDTSAERAAGFALSLGFSDQLFLARRADLGRPVYGDRCVAALRNPMAHLGWIFEMRVDSYMRHNGFLRASELSSRYLHPPETAGLSYPSSALRARLRRARNMAVVAYLRNAPARLRPRCARDLGGGA
jgi:hypothetical protein